MTDKHLTKLMSRFELLNGADFASLSPNGRLMALRAWAEETAAQSDHAVELSRQFLQIGADIFSKPFTCQEDGVTAMETLAERMGAAISSYKETVMASRRTIAITMRQCGLKLSTTTRQ
ncbi:MAG: hypothetical protein ACREF8_07000 [Chthoniobacterales bacterium]